MNNVVAQLAEETWLAGLPNGRQAEKTASDWHWDALRRTLRLSLRRNIVFHDNTPLTSELAAEILRKSVANQDAPSFTDIESISASGPDKVDIYLKEPNAFLLPDLTLVSVLKPGKDPSSTGPFEVVTRSSQDVVLRPDPQYYRGRPGLTEIDVKTYPTQRNAWAALMRGDIDMLSEVSRDAAEFVQAESTVKTYSVPRPYYISLVFNLRHSVLKDVEVRKALNQALDRVALVRDGLNNWGQPADGPVPPEHWAYSAGTPFVFDPIAARKRLDAAGYRLKPASRGAVPNRFTFKCLVYTGDSRFERLAVLVQKQLADVGVDMELVPVKDPRELGRRFATGDFDSFLFEMYGRSLSYAYLFWHSQPTGAAALNSGYRAADAALDSLKTARTDDETKAAVAELMKVMHDDPPAAFLAWQETIRAVSAKFDLQAEQGRDIFSNVWQWHLAAPNQQGAR